MSKENKKNKKKTRGEKEKKEKRKIKKKKESRSVSDRPTSISISFDSGNNRFNFLQELCFGDRTHHLIDHFTILEKEQ